MTLQQRLDSLINQMGIDYKSQQTSITTLTTSIGLLPGLSTTAKNSLVAAINEIYAIANSGANVIDDAQTASAVKTYSINKIKAEILTLKNDLLGGVPAAAFDTLKEIADYIAADQTGGASMAVSIGNRVSYTGADGKTAGEKLQARQNIDAYGSVELGNPDTDLLAIYNAAKL
jgi:hypothetical protein